MEISKTGVACTVAGVALAFVSTLGIQAGGDAIRSHQADTYTVSTPNVEHISWHIPDDWTQGDTVVNYDQQIDYSQISTITAYTFDPNQVIETDDSGLTDYSTSLPIQSDWTMVSDVYTDKVAPTLDVDNKTYMKFQNFGYNPGNKQSALSRGAYAYTGPYQMRMVDGRILIALGTNYCTTIGTYIDIRLANGNIIPCILGDVKSDLHTDPTHSFQKWDHSVMEIIVDSPGTSRTDYSVIKSIPELQGGGSYSVLSGFDSPVVNIRVYDKVFPYTLGDLTNDNPDY